MERQNDGVPRRGDAVRERTFVPRRVQTPQEEVANSVSHGVGLVAALAAEGVACFEGYCRPLYREPLFSADSRNRPGLCPIVESLYDETLLFHAWLHPEIEPFAAGIADAFEKVWEFSASLGKCCEEREPAIRRG